jgi:hypothetical protein
MEIVNSFIFLSFWMMGTGTINNASDTVLMIEYDFIDVNDLIGSIKVRRIVDAGGGYTIEARK